MDQTLDLSGQQLYRLTRLYPPPDFVKRASTEELCGDDLPPEAYGDPRRKLFPGHTAAATWTSMAFLLDKQAEMRPLDAEMINERIMRCGVLHGITKELDALKKQAAEGKRIPEDLATLSDDDFGLVVGNSRHCPLRNPQEVKEASAYLFKHRDQLPFELRRAFADKILAKQAAFGVTLGQEMNAYVEKQAGYGACTAKEAATLIRNRVHATSNFGPRTELQQEMLKLAELIETRPSQLRAPGMRVKVAAVVDHFDREMKLVGHYGPDFPRVEDVIFDLTREKVAEAAREHCSTVTGNIYALRDLERLKLAEVRDYFGDEFADRMTSDGIHVDSEKAAQLLPTLPRNDISHLERLMNDLGIKPMAKEASSQAIGISHKYLQELAENRRRALAGS